MRNATACPAVRAMRRRFVLMQILEVSFNNTDFGAPIPTDDLY